VTVRTRFAPSPTGYLHIGGVRTALFNWLFTRRHGGQFILRIDDTDQQRNVESALAPILHGFRWLGIDWDEGPEVGGPHGPYYQSQRSANYQAAVEKLLAAGFAYRDYARTEEIAAERDAAQKEKRSFLYSRQFMAESDADRRRFEAAGREAVVRLKMPREGSLVIDDLIRGRVEFQWSNEQDHVIQRADGSCLYHLASVVDDHDFEISHVIRAEEHLSNTPRQIFILESLGYPRPQYAHLPYVAEPGSKTKLSKRKLDKYLKNRDFAQVYEHGRAIVNALGQEPSAETFNPVIVDFYEQTGYLPDAIVNYLALLGWSLDDRSEFFTRAEMIELFSLERVNSAPASFDPKKLSAFQDHYMQALPSAEKIAMTLPYLQRAGTLNDPVSDPQRRTLEQILAAAGDRIKVAGDILDYRDFFLPADQLKYDEAAFDKQLRQQPDAVVRLKRFREQLADASAFDAASLEALLQQFLAAEGIPASKIIHAVRISATGKSVGFGLFETLATLGQQESLARIDRAISLVDA